MSEWAHPTLADTGVTGLVNCRCGRTKLPTDMLDVRALGVGESHLCSACVEDLLRTGAVDHLTLHRRAGAPVEWLAAYEAKLRAGPLLRTGLPPEIWGEILAQALDLAAAEALAALPPPEPPL